MEKVNEAHQNLRHLLFNGRIILNGAPLTTNELSQLIQAEQLLYNGVIELEKSKLPAVKEAEKQPKK